MSLKTLKCVVVGDGTVGKTCLLIRYANDEYPLDYIPTVFENYAVAIPIQNETYDFHLFDTAGQEAYDHLRKFTFDNANVFIVCYSVVLWTSFLNVREKWIPELQEHCPKIPYILVGTKTDLRNDEETIEKLTAEGRSPITKEQGETLALELKAAAYLECSALTRENVENVFKTAMHTAVSEINTKPVISRSQSVINNNIVKNLNKKCCDCTRIAKVFRNSCVLM